MPRNRDRPARRRGIHAAVAAKRHSGLGDAEQPDDERDDDAASRHNPDKNSGELAGFLTHGVSFVTRDDR